MDFYVLAFASDKMSDFIFFPIILILIKTNQRKL